jgi:hypothetical protein
MTEVPLLIRLLGVRIVDNVSAKIVATNPQIQISDGKGNTYQVQKIAVTAGSWTNTVLSQAGTNSFQ